MTTTATPAARASNGKAAANGNKPHVVARSFPAPAQLATPTDLHPDEVQAITEALNPRVATAFALYTKTKNFHWHLSGSHFRDYHLMLDDQADALLESIDIMAERVRRIGGTTIRSIGHIGQLQLIEDDNADYVAPADMMQRLRDDNRNYAAAIRAAHEVCEDNRDVATASFLETILDDTERRTWFLFEITVGAENAA